jgi:hypothetical protein
MSDKTPGSCLCGAVRFAIEGESRVFQYCHCSRCRKGSGSAHAANLFVDKEQLTWEVGEDHVQRFELPEAKWWSRAFCKSCGASMPWLSRNGKSFIVPAGALDEDPGTRPTRNIYFGSAAPWYVHASELEIFDTVPS